VFTLPSALPLIGVTLPLSSWLKATLALLLSVAGFVSDNALRAIRARRDGGHREMTLFMLHWGNYFVIVIMASSAASVIGVPELVSRCNSVVAMTGRTSMML
jgi:polar amino acid transport system permease protein